MPAPAPCSSCHPSRCQVQSNMLTLRRSALCHASIMLHNSHIWSDWKPSADNDGKSLVTSKTLKYSLVLCYFEVAACEISLDPQANVLKVRARWSRVRSLCCLHRPTPLRLKDTMFRIQHRSKEAVSEFANTPHSAH